MELVYIFDADALEFIFVIGNTGFKSVVSLKKFLNTPCLPDLFLSGLLVVGELAMSLCFLRSKRSKIFKAFCAEKNIEFVLIPSG